MPAGERDKPDPALILPSEASRLRNPSAKARGSNEENTRSQNSTKLNIPDPSRKLQRGDGTIVDLDSLPDAKDIDFSYSADESVPSPNKKQRKLTEKQQAIVVNGERNAKATNNTAKRRSVEVQQKSCKRQKIGLTEMTGDDETNKDEAEGNDEVEDGEEDDTPMDEDKKQYWDAKKVENPNIRISRVKSRATDDLRISFKKGTYTLGGKETPGEFCQFCLKAKKTRKESFFLGNVTA
ncbi:hypothetical protein K435DRAFT_802395 [Dendrothele bispora CBS 962.96]|uniref:Uncharacterized protein n=1 Tax=Dendrothele bispora (strain CBS 962.96) TaxID=1314807 RepID=A0A4S8LL14_DENBC|nr:hypothetical protein K435DRAFT_802395 [Dendrothele bispora CBS 962.96]